MLTGWLEHPLGKLAIAALLGVFNYHLVHGVRHLLWDIGLGFSRANQIKLGLLELVSALTLTALMAFAPCFIHYGSVA